MRANNFPNTTLSYANKYMNAVIRIFKVYSKTDSYYQNKQN